MPKGCLKCGALNADDARFCRQCGTTLTEATAGPTPAALPEVACRQCGHLNRPGVAFCAKCGTDQRTAATLAAAFAAPPRRQPLGLWAGLAAVLIALVAGASWWFNSTREPAGPAFDSAPPPSVANGIASGPAQAASMPAPAPSEAQATPVAPAPALDAVSPTAPSPTEAVTASAPSSAAAPPVASRSTEPPTTDQAAREARAKALRDQRAKRAQAASQAEAATLANRRAEEARARSTQPATAPVAAPAPRPSAAVSQARTVQERCGNENVLLRSICEARECINREHAGEPACLRVKAAEDRRRQREGGG